MSSRSLPDRPAVFVSGATGLLGHALARTLLARGRRVVLLARGTRNASAQDRIDRLMMERYPSWADYAQDRAQIQVLQGDMCEPLLGLEPEEYNALRLSIDAVVHCAALLNFLPEQRDAVMRANLEGSMRAHELARDAGLDTVHVVSTAYVVGGLPRGGKRPTSAHPEAPCASERRFNNPYEESKFRAEQLLAQLDAASGLKSTIYRPSCIIGEYDSGRTITFRTLYGFIDLIDQERIRLQRQEQVNPATKRLIYFSDIPRDATRNVVPVDYVADTMAHIIEYPALHGRIYHLTNPAPPNRWESNRWMARAVGFGDLVMPSDASRLPSSELVSFQPGRLSRFSKVFSGYLEEHEPLFDDRNTREALAGTRIACPAIDEAYLGRVVRYCLETRWRTDVEREAAAKIERGSQADEAGQLETDSSAGMARPPETDFSAGLVRSLETDRAPEVER